MTLTPYEIALHEIGVQEQSGSKHNPRIIEYHACTSLKATADEIPWCASFVNWCLRVAGIVGTNSARARSFLTWGVPVPITEAQRGDIVVLARGKNISEGHVGFYTGRKDNNVLLLGGNQSNRVSISTFPLSTIISIRRQP
jgi:uncharacterized protein (TIGR02594 family)